MEFTNPPPIWMNTGNIAREFLGDHGPSISVDRQNNFLDGGTGSRPVDLHTSNMPKHYVCSYCGVALTHDSLSVRRSHALGRNHIKYVTDYYENAAKEVGLIPEEMPSSTDPYAFIDARPLNANPLDQSDQLRNLNQGAPGVGYRNKEDPLRFLSAKTVMPPPASIPSLPAPPPQFYSVGQ